MGIGKPKITVIMPSYNVGAYIDECLQSVRDQSLRELEILCVDAGSTDGTLETIRRHASEDSRIQMISSDKKSYGYQMNLGLSLATGEYIGVVETDDMIYRDMYEKLYTIAEFSHADYVKGAVEGFVSLGEGRYYKELFQTNPLESAQRELELCPKDTPQLLLQDIFFWCGIYRREFLKDIRFNETPGAAYQDQGFLLQTLSKAGLAVYVSDPVYLYRQDNNGSSMYNPKGICFIETEYSLNTRFIEDLDRRWKSVFYQRYFFQCMARFRYMGKGGCFWEEARPSIEKISSLLQEAKEKTYLTEEKLTGEHWKSLQLYLDSPYKLYEHYAMYWQEKKRRVEMVLSTTANKEVVIFGAGRVGRFVQALLQKRGGTKGLTFCDSNENIWGNKINGLSVLSPKEAYKRFPNAVYVLSGRRFEEDMRALLIQLGVSENRIVIYEAGREIALLVG